MQEGKEIAVIEPQRSALLRPVAPVADILVAQNEAREVISKALTKGRDYGVVPGTGGKATLFKPGAERVNAAFGAAATFKVVEREVDHDRPNEYEKRGQKLTSLGLYRYVVNCTLVQRETGMPLGEGIGVCSTMESKYIGRPRDVENTVLKMAEKRALIAATLVAYGLSDQFTQDAEDMAQGDEDEPPATEKQVGFLKRLMKSSVFTDKVRKAVEAEYDGLTKARAMELIDEAQTRIAAAEAVDEGDSVGPADREPGEDDSDSLPF